MSPTCAQIIEECLSDAVVAFEILNSVTPISDEIFGTRVFDFNKVLPCQKNFVPPDEVTPSVLAGPKNKEKFNFFYFISLRYFWLF